jgi:hypothetical protein
MAYTIYETGCSSIRFSRRSLRLCGEKLFPALPGTSRISSSGLEPRLIQRDEKLPPTMCAPRRGKKDHIPWTMVHRLLLAVRAFDQMSIRTKIDKIAFRHNLSNPNAEQ